MRVSVMSKDVLGSMPKGNSDWDSAFDAVRRLDAARRTVEDVVGGDRRSATRTDSDQMARAIAEIEHATAALRKAEPALEAWTERPRSRTRPPRKPRSVWVIIGVLWLSTALVTAGAVAAIAKLVG
jgi:hypothetical protein